MFLCDAWKDYEVLDTGDGEKLERWGKVVLRRPDPQTIWPKAEPALWERADAIYHRSEKGGGQWEFRRQLPDRWTVSLDGLEFYVPPDSSIPGSFRSRRPTGGGWRKPSEAPDGRMCGC